MFSNPLFSNPHFVPSKNGSENSKDAKKAKKASAAGPTPTPQKRRMAESDKKAVR